MKISDMNTISTHRAGTSSVPRFVRRWLSAHVAQYELASRRADHGGDTLLPPTA